MPRLGSMSNYIMLAYRCIFGERLRLAKSNKRAERFVTTVNLRGVAEIMS